MAATTQSLTNNVVLSATLQRRSKGYVDQIVKQLPFFWWMKQKKRYKAKNGGARLEWPVQYALDDREKSYHGFDLLPKQEQDNVTIAFASWKEYYADIVISGRDKAINKGEGVIFDLLQQREDNALASLQEQMNTDLYSDGTGNNSKRITGLGAIVPEDPTSGTLFGINRANEPWWRSQYLDVNAPYYDESKSRFTLRNQMEVIRTRCGRVKTGGKGMRYPDLILCSETFQHYYSRGLDKGQRYVNTKAADAGFNTLTFMGGTIMEDQDCPESSTPGEHQAFFLNSDFLEWAYHPDLNFKVTEMRQAENQHAFYAYIFWMGEVLCTCCAKQGRLFGVQNVT